MTKKLVLGSLCAIMLMAAMSCTTYKFDGHSVDNGTTVFYPDDTITWAYYLDMYANSYARYYARQAATSQQQETQQTSQWVFVGYDFEFDKMELSAAIAKGTHKLGNLIKNTYFSPGSSLAQQGSSHSGGVVTHRIIREAEHGLIDPSKPGTYAPVYVLQTRNETKTVTVRDDAKQKKYEDLYRGNYQRARQNYILSKFESDNAFNVGNIYEAEIVKNRLEQRLREELPPGSMLAYGGYGSGPGYGFGSEEEDLKKEEDVIFAWIDDDDDSFVWLTIK